MNDLPPVAVHDLVIHPRDNDLVAGTHGRSIWIADDISPLQQLKSGALDDPLYLFQSRPGTKWASFNKGRIQTHFKFRGENPPRGAAVRFYLKEMPADSTARIEIADLFTGRMQSIEIKVQPGINKARWNMSFELDEVEVSDHKRRLQEMASAIQTALEAAETDERLFHMARDLRAAHRAPNLFAGKEYRHIDDDRDLLLKHLDYIEERVTEADNARRLDDVRDELTAYSSLVGDAAYTGFFGDPIRDMEAPAGRYIVTVTAGTHRTQGHLEIRDDPLNRQD